MFAYSMPSILTHFQRILIENLSNPIRINPKSTKIHRYGQPCFPKAPSNEDWIWAESVMRTRHSLFNPHLSSLVPLKIVQVELEKHIFWFKTHGKPKNYKNNMYEKKVSGCGDGIPRCRLCSHTLCHHF